MIFTTKAEYGVRLLVELGRHHEDGSPVSLKAIAEAVLSHRLIVAPEARAAGTMSVDLVRDALDKTPVPV